LPWRDTHDLWKILVSEIMLQQTRVEAVIPYYHRFLERFPDAQTLADAAEADVLTAWSGLGYYSRARNLQRAARSIANEFPTTYEGVRALPGVGPYAGAAVASIGLGLPHAAVDGNVLRVISRLTADAADIAMQSTRDRFTRVAQELLDTERPGDFNQAMMELGATVCLPRTPQCLLCPVARNCAARTQGRQSELPVKRRKEALSSALLEVSIVRRGDMILLRQRAGSERRMANFWELPARDSIHAEGLAVASFRHTIVNTVFTVNVYFAEAARHPAGMRWFREDELSRIPLTTVSKKALALVPAVIP
jgi:A/G-specific adenine glycosylase